MTFDRGAAACFKLHGGCSYQKTEPGIETCRRCDTVQFIPYTDDEVFMFEGRDAALELQRADDEACGRPSDNEADAHRGSPET